MSPNYLISNGPCVNIKLCFDSRNNGLGYFESRNSRGHMGSLISHCVSIASASRVREGILVALGCHFNESNVSGQSARSWLSACFQRYDENGTGLVPCDAVLNVVAELTLFRIHEWSANEVSQFCAFFFRGEESEQNFDYQLFLDYIFFPVTKRAPKIKLKVQIATNDLFNIHKGILFPATRGPEELNEPGCRPVILKMCDLTKIASETGQLTQFDGVGDLANQLRRRVNELRLLTHPNLVTYQTTLQNKTSFFIIQDDHEICTLRTILESFGPMKEPTIRRYLLQLLQGLSFLHDHGVNHGNLTMQAVNIDSYGLLKIADFGLRRSLLPLFSSAKATDADWTRKYLESEVAPEVLRDSRLWGEKTDVWCVGMLTLQMANGFKNFQPRKSFEPIDRKVPASPRNIQFLNRSPSRSPTKTRGSVSPKGIRLPALPESTSKGLTSLVRACLQRDPRKRSTIRELIEMGFFRVDQAKETNEVLRTVCTDLDATIRRLKSTSPKAKKRR